MPNCSKCGTAAAFHELSNFAIPATPGETVERLCFKCTQEDLARLPFWEAHMADRLRAAEKELERLRAQISREVNIVADLIVERDAARKQCAAMRQAIEDFVYNIKHHHVAGWGDVSRCDVAADNSFKELMKAISTDAGRDYIAKEQIKPLVEALQFAHMDSLCVDPATSTRYDPCPICKALAHAKKLGLLSSDRIVTKCEGIKLHGQIPTELPGTESDALRERATWERDAKEAP